MIKKLMSVAALFFGSSQALAWHPITVDECFNKPHCETAYIRWTANHFTTFPTQEAGINIFLFNNRGQKRELVRTILQKDIGEVALTFDRSRGLHVVELYGNSYGPAAVDITHGTRYDVVLPLTPGARDPRGHYPRR